VTAYPFERIVFVLRGSTAALRVESLDRVRALFEAEPKERVVDSAGSGDFLYVLVSRPRGESGVRLALAYARDEIEAGIGEAGGTLSDGTAVQISAMRL
jgi:hypothetical protein